MRLVVTRPAGDGARTAKRLTGLGHEAIIAPLIQVNPLSTPAPQLQAIWPALQAVAVTSANGIRVLADMTPGRDVPVYAVGPATAAAAKEAGFKKVTTAGGDVDALAKLIISERKADGGPILHPAGSKLAGDLKGQLEQAGFTCHRIRLYEADPVATLPEPALDALNKKEADGVLLYSPRTARLWAKRLEEAKLVDAAKTLPHYCLSNAVAEGLAPLGLPSHLLKTASTPTEDALFALLTSGKGKMEDKPDISRITKEVGEKVSENVKRDPRSASSGAKAGSGIPNAGKKQAAKPAQQKSAGGGFFAKTLLLLSGLMAAALGGAVGWAFVIKLLPQDIIASLPEPLRPVVMAPASSADLGPLQGQLDQLDQRVSALANRPAATGEVDEGRLAGLEDTVAAVGSELGLLQDRIRDVENRPATTDDGEMVDMAALDALSERLAALEESQGQIAVDLNQRLDERLADQEGKVTGQARVIATEVATQIAATIAEGAGSAKASAGVLAFAALEKAARGSDPFPNSWQAYRDIADDLTQAEIDVVDHAAQNGVASHAALAASFTPLARQVLRAEAAPADAPWYRRLLGNAVTLVTVRPVGDVAGDGSPERLARIEARLAEGAIRAAVREAKLITGPGGDLLRPWILKAEDRIALDSVIAGLGDQLTRQLAGIE